METNNCAKFRNEMVVFLTTGMLAATLISCGEKILLEKVTIGPNDTARLVTLDGDKDEDNVAIYKGLFGEKEVPSGTMAAIIPIKEEEKEYYVILEGGPKIITKVSGKIHEGIPMTDIAKIGIVPEGEIFYIKINDDESITISAGTEVRILKLSASFTQFCEAEDLVQANKDGQYISGLMKHSDTIKLNSRETQTYSVEDIRIFTLRKGTEVDGEILEKNTNFFGSEECSTEHEKFIFLPNGQGQFVPVDRVKETMRLVAPPEKEADR